MPLKKREHFSSQMVNWLDLGGNTVPEGVANLVTERWYFQVGMVLHMVLHG